jgi:glutathione S-transferase
MTDYEIIYHEGFSGRAISIIHILLEAGLTYTLVAPSWGADRCATPNPGHPVFAPPVLRKGDFLLAQTSAIMQYLGTKYGPTAANAEDAAKASIKFH